MGRISYFLQLILQLMYEGFCFLEVTGRFDCASRSDTSLFSQGVKYWVPRSWLKERKIFTHNFHAQTVLEVNEIFLQCMLDQERWSHIGRFICTMEHTKSCTWTISNKNKDHTWLNQISIKSSTEFLPKLAVAIDRNRLRNERLPVNELV